MAGAAAHAPADYRHRPEKPQVGRQWLDRMQRLIKGRLLKDGMHARLRRQRFLKAVAGHADTFGQAADDVLLDRARALGGELRVAGFRDAEVAELFAIIREVSGRLLGKRHFDSQLAGGWIMLQGRIAEMKTGEGKTLTAVLPVVTAALSGLPVHVVTVNDYLTARDAEEMSPVYCAFGLDVSVITHETTPEQRRLAYQADIVYVTGKELVFDYLRDRMKLDQTHPLRLHVAALHRPRLENELQLRGLHFALVDEADSVLIDESRTPLIISGTSGNEEGERFIREAFKLSLSLQEGEDFKLLAERRTIEMTEHGVENIRRLSEGMGPLWRGAIRREEVVHKALLARLVYQRDRDYLVRDGKVELIDQLTGRVMAGRSWEKGLHQMVELKEDCELTRQRETLARISYQDFFRRYLYLSGMTGTANEVRQELWKTYQLPVSSVPTHKPEQRETHASLVFESRKEQWQAVVESCRAMIAAGRSVLIGTDSVASSEEAGHYLQEAGIAHRVLSAKQDSEEADIVAQAGQPGRITVATSMAGRGTDIALAPSVEAAGGLHVIQTEHYESARVDRQLAGRCARQGNPGSYQMLLSIESQPVRTLQAKSLLTTAQTMGLQTAAGQKLALKALRTEQKFIERQNYLARQATLEYDLRQNELLAFSGRVE